MISGLNYGTWKETENTLLIVDTDNQNVDFCAEVKKATALSREGRAAYAAATPAERPTRTALPFCPQRPKPPVRGARGPLGPFLGEAAALAPPPAASASGGTAP